MSDFKITLEAARVNAHFTQVAVAEKIGVNVATIKNWESGNTVPATDLFMKLCELYKCPMSIISLQKKLANS